MPIKSAQPSAGSGSDSAPKPSALRVATLRAVHQLLDAPQVYEDPLALKILGAAEEQALRGDPARYDTPLLKGLRASLPHLRIVPTGGVTLETAAAFLKTGCAALGIGSALVSSQILRAANWPELTRRAKAFVEVVRGVDRVGASVVIEQRL